MFLNESQGQTEREKHRTHHSVVVLQRQCQRVVVVRILSEVQLLFEDSSENQLCIVDGYIGGRGREEGGGGL